MIKDHISAWFIIFISFFLDAKNNEQPQSKYIDTYYIIDFSFTKTVQLFNKTIAKFRDKYLNNKIFANDRISFLFISNDFSYMLLPKQDLLGPCSEFPLNSNIDSQLFYSLPEIKHRFMIAIDSEIEVQSKVQ